MHLAYCRFLLRSRTLTRANGQRFVDRSWGRRAERSISSSGIRTYSKPPTFHCLLVFRNPAKRIREWNSADTAVMHVIMRSRR